MQLKPVWFVLPFLRSCLSQILVTAANYEKRSISTTDFSAVEMIPIPSLLHCSILCKSKGCDCFAFETGNCTIGSCPQYKTLEPGLRNLTVHVNTNIEKEKSCCTPGDCGEPVLKVCDGGLCRDLEKQLLAIGGHMSGSKSASVEVVECTGSCLRRVQDLPVAMTFTTATVLDGVVYACGTNTSNQQDCYKTDCSGNWSPFPPPSSPASASRLKIIAVGSRIVSSGGRSSSALDIIEEINPNVGVWTKKGFVLSPPRYEHCAVAVSSSELVFAGGRDLANYLKKSEILNIDTGFFTPLSDIPGNGIYLCACTLFEGKILMTGGHDGSVAMSTVLTLDYKTVGSAWIAMGSLTKPKFAHDAIIWDGKPMILGGSGSDGGSVEEFVDGVWSRLLTNSLAAPRMWFSSVILQC